MHVIFMVNTLIVDEMSPVFGLTNDQNLAFQWIS